MNATSTTTAAINTAVTQPSLLSLLNLICGRIEMKRSLIATLAVGSLLLGLPPLLAQHGGGHEHGTPAAKVPAAPAQEKEAPQTLQGEIIDLACYIRHAALGEKHLKCAEHCAELSLPLGLLEDQTNQVYLILPPGHTDPRPLVLPHLGKRVRVQGQHYAMGGMNGLEIGKIEALEE